MKNLSFAAKCLYDNLQSNIILTLDELKSCVEKKSTMTIHRKLKELDYLSSCSHSGKYYTLKKKAIFDKFGLWHYKLILFSNHGNLISTIQSMIENSDNGFTALELKNILKIIPNETLASLYHCNQVIRNKEGSSYVYYSLDKETYVRQSSARKSSSHKIIILNEVILDDNLKSQIIIFYSTLNEKQRRIYAGLESIKYGKGGDSFFSKFLDMNIKTVQRGRTELNDRDVDGSKIRSDGAGRKSIKKTQK